jgi:hypothetical protein
VRKCFYYFDCVISFLHENKEVHALKREIERALI